MQGYGKDAFKVCDCIGAYAENDLHKKGWIIKMDNEDKKQFLTKTYELNLEEVLRKIIAKGGYIDHAIPYQHIWLIVYSADKKLVEDAG